VRGDPPHRELPQRTVAVTRTPVPDPHPSPGPLALRGVIRARKPGARPPSSAAQSPSRSPSQHGGRQVGSSATASAQPVRTVHGTHYPEEPQPWGSGTELAAADHDDAVAANAGGVGSTDAVRPARARGLIACIRSMFGWRQQGEGGGAAAAGTGGGGGRAAVAPRVASQTMEERILEGRLRADAEEDEDEEVGALSAVPRASTRESPSGCEDPSRAGSGRGSARPNTAASRGAVSTAGVKPKDGPMMTSSRRFGVTDPSACEAGPARHDAVGAGSAGSGTLAGRTSEPRTHSGRGCGPDRWETSSSGVGLWGAHQLKRRVTPGGTDLAPRTVAEEVECVRRRAKYQLPAGVSFDGGSDEQSPDGFQTPLPREPTLDHSRRDRKYLDKVREYRRQERFRIRVFAGQAIDDAVERGRRVHEASAPSRRGSNPRPGLVDPDAVDLPTCPICESNPATVVAVPCDHCCVCRECAARHRIMSVASAAAERREADQALARAEQQERTVRSREETMQMALTSGRADIALTPGVRESIEADLHDARVRREAALYVRHVPPTTRCPVCSFRIDAMLDLSRVAQLRRAYGGAAQLPETFTAGFATGWPGRTRAAARAFSAHARQRDGHEPTGPKIRPSPQSVEGAAAGPAF